MVENASIPTFVVAAIAADVVLGQPTGGRRTFRDAEGCLDTRGLANVLAKPIAIAGTLPKIEATESVSI